MRRPSFVLLGMVTVGLGAAGAVGLHYWLRAEQARLEREHAQAFRERDTHWAEAAWQLRQQLERETWPERQQWTSNAHAAVQRERRELEAALGGPVPMVVKNPDLSLSAMIHGVALACTPAGTRAAVTVDRFTEFDLVLALPGLETRLVLADCARCILEPCAPYLHSLRFTYDTNVLAALDRRQLDRVAQWDGATRDQVLELFQAADQPRAAGAVSGPGRNESGLRPNPGGIVSTNRASGIGQAAGSVDARGENSPYAAYDQRLLSRINQALQRVFETENLHPTERQGEVVLQGRLHADGRLTDIQVVNSEPGALPARVYLRAVRDAGPFPEWDATMREGTDGEVRTVILKGTRALRLETR